MNPVRRAFLILVSALTLLALVSPPGAADAEHPTPLLLAVHDAPIPFTGSDGRLHLVYELWVTNFSSGDSTLETVDILGDDTVLQTLDSAAIAHRLQPAGQRESTGVLSKSMQALLFLHVTLAPGATPPKQLSHRVKARFMAAPPGHQELTETGGTTEIDRQSVAQIGPPLLGDNYISADSCCDAVRHSRAALPVNGRVWIAQRYAVDWEQLDTAHRIYEGPRERLQSYTIFGKPAIAVADAVVSAVTDGLPEQIPGQYPTNISLDAADGDSVILDLGNHRYALYAHLQPGSIKVRPRDSVKRGQVLGLVGNSGNSVAPHLHFQVTDSPSSLASNGLPYEIDQLKITGRTAGTEAFDHAEAEGTPLEMTPLDPPQLVRDGLPLDQLVISFAP